MSSFLDIVESDEEEDCITTAERDWVGTQRKWPKEPPAELEVYLARQLSLPAHVANVVFKPAYESVHGLMQASLPATSNDMVFQNPKSWFSPLAPNADTVTCNRATSATHSHAYLGPSATT